MDPITDWVVLSLGFSLLIWYFRIRIKVNQQASISQTSERPPTSLAAFVDDNQRLIATLGVFTALTVFVGNLPAKLFGFLLSFLFLIGTILLWSELSSRFPKLRTERLYWFQSIIEVAVPILIIYLILQFSVIIRYFLNYLMVIVAIWLGAILTDRLKFDERIAVRVKNLRLRNMISVLILALFAILGSYSATYFLSPLFDNAIALLDSVASSLPK